MEGLDTKINQPETNETISPPKAVETRAENINSAEASYAQRFNSKLEPAEKVWERLREQPHFKDLFERSL